MLELETFRSVVGLFKEVVGLIDQRNKNKRELFERTCKPLYDRLELIFKDYYAALAVATSELDKSQPDLRGILRDMNDRRSALIIARNGIMGEAEALVGHYVSPLEAASIRRRPKLDELIRAFALDVLGLFRTTYDDYLDERIALPEVVDNTAPAAPPTTAMTSLADEIRLLIHLTAAHKNRRPKSPDDLRQVRATAKQLLRAMEERWQAVTSSFTDVKLACGA